MSGEGEGRAGAFERQAQRVLVMLAAALLAWVGWSVTSLREEAVAVRVHIEQLRRDVSRLQEGVSGLAGALRDEAARLSHRVERLESRSREGG
ncbi:MAG: hypothetical protein HY521_14940 [Proteobacteria bacterium]|nr:hypothetical protein [Pseudomonadota bacterium]